MTKHLALIYILVGLLSLRGCPSAEGTRGSVGLGIKCGEVTVTITAKRRFFEENRVPFKPEHLRLGTESANCKPTAQVSDSEIIISVGLQECGADFYVRDEWLVYFNQLVLLPAVVPTATGTMIVRGTGTSIPVECHYRSKQTVSGEPLTPTWRPMTSTIRSSGLLHFTLRTMQDGCTSPRSSSVYQQGEAVFLEASVQAPLHPPLTIYVDYCVATLKPDPLSLPSYKFVAKHGCLMDSVLPDSSSKFLSRHHDNRLCFSVQAFRFNQKFEETVFITCHLKATLKNTLKSYHNKACFFHKPTFSWRSTEGDGALCDCCDTDCFRHIENKNDTGYTTEIGLLALLLIVLKWTQPGLPSPLRPICDLRVLNHFIKEARDTEVAMKSCTEGCSLSESVTVPQTRVDFDVWEKKNSSEQALEVQTGIWLLQHAFDLLQSSVTNTELQSHIENSIRNLLSINAVLRSLNIQEFTPPASAAELEETWMVSSATDLLQVHVNFLRGKVRLLLLDAQACQQDVS